ncbi:MAG: hypothetical protein EPN97_10445 [Alphaproteobacteria bacterium]|nr:MAG: hypothetical protein EPN97_10445 [Alphaproteobacteria bacterium]
MTKPDRIEHRNGGYEYRLNGQLHREDGPAVDSGKGDTWWFRNNLLHREGGPAVEHATGSKWWYKNGALHREDGPAYEGADGTKAWYLNGKPIDPPVKSPGDSSLRKPKNKGPSLGP